MAQAVTHAIFDMDGLLLDTESHYTIVQQQICSRLGREFTWQLKSKMMGQKALDAAKILVDELRLGGAITPEQFILEREAALDALFPTAQLLPGAERLLRHLHAHGVPTALATSSHRRHFELKTQLHGQLFSLFEHITTGDAVQRGKPAPDIFLAAAARWEPAPDPAACLIFEDAPSGVAAAAAAGMRCVMVPDPHLNPLQCSGAHEVLRSLEEFDPEKYGLPPFGDPPELAKAVAEVTGEDMGPTAADGFQSGFQSEAVQACERHA